MQLQSSVIGLDISSDAVRMVYLRKSRNSTSLEYADYEALPAGSADDKGIINGSVVSECIRNMLNRSRVRNKNVATAIPATASIIKVINLADTLNESEIEDHLRYEGGHHIPYSMDAVNFDFMQVGPSDTQKGFNKVLLVASKKELVDDIVAVMEEAGLKPKLVDVKSFSLFNLSNHLDAVNGFNEKDPNKSLLLIDVGSTVTTVYAFQNGIPIYSRDHAFGYFRLIESLQNQYNLSREDAIRMEKFGGLPPEYAKDVLPNFAHSIAQELFRSVDFFQASTPDAPISRIRIFGYAAKYDMIGSYLKQMLPCDIDMPDPFYGMRIAPNISQTFLESNKNSMAAACGLSLRGH